MSYKNFFQIPFGGCWAVDKGRVVVFDSDWEATEPIKINAAARPTCLTGIITKNDSYIPPSDPGRIDRNGVQAHGNFVDFYGYADLYLHPPRFQGPARRVH